MLSKYKDAAEIAHRVLEAVVKLAVEGATVLSLCQEGDKLLDEETQKVYKGKKISKGMIFIESSRSIDYVSSWRFVGICISHLHTGFAVLEFSLMSCSDRNCFPYYCFAQ